MVYFIALIIALALLVIGITRFNIHPFFVLIITAIAYGFMTGMKVEMIIESINTGFGDLMGKIGLIILFGVVIGTVLEKSGGAMVLATGILKLIGNRSVHLAMMITGYILSIPIFADSAFLMMNPLNKVLSFRAKVSYAGTTAALALGLTATHVMVPPTPGPIAAAGVLGANLGSVIMWGLLISAVSLIPCYFFARFVASKVKVPIITEKIADSEQKPKLWKSVLAIIIPMLLIVGKSIIQYPGVDIPDSILKKAVIFLGTPVIALLAGVILSLLLPKKLDNKVFSASGWFGESVRIAAPIILITGAGGIFGKMLQNSGIADVITTNFSSFNIGLLFPFLLAASLKTTQGSSTVALITTASIIAPIMTVLGLNTPFLVTMTVLAIGAGSAVMSHVNDSFFWVLTQLTGMNVKQGNVVQTAGTFVFGVSAMCVIYLFTLFIK